MTQEKFLKLLFDADQRTCFAEDAKGTAVKVCPGPKDVFFSVNALHPTQDLQPTEEWHATDKPRRADHNVICHRNFLIELDSMPIKQQIDYVRSRVPVSAITFSGSKSYHFIISLTEAVSAAEYARIAAGLLRLLPEADRTTKNPSRLSRLPNVIRPETRNLQELVYVGSRVALKELPEFPAAPTFYERPTSPNILFVSQQIREVQSMGVDNYIETHFSGRNQFFYWLGKRSSELGHTKEEKKTMIQNFYNRLSNKKGFSVKEAFLAARVKV